MYIWKIGAMGCVIRKIMSLEYLDLLYLNLLVKRILLPDTLGVLIPTEVAEFISELVQRYPGVHFDFHAHNDYDLGTANALEAVRNWGYMACI
jgi:D-citramalate synthase